MKRGRVVRSLKGRNKNDLAVIMSVDEKFAYIADGRMYKTVKPKLKNIKHLEATESVLDEYYLEADSRLRKQLSRLKDIY